MTENQNSAERVPRSTGEAHAASGAYLAAYVDRLRESGVLRDAAVEQAFRRVPRHLFVERFFVGDEEQGWTPIEHTPEDPQPEHLETIYSGAALITRLDGNLGTSSSSQPALVAEMLQLLELPPGLRVLEIGAGTGYNAALLAEIVGDAGHVTTVDIQEDVVEQARRSLARAGYGGVRTLCRDGVVGAPEGAPFDRIVATVGCPDVSPRWVEQLTASGFLLVPLRHAGANPLVRLWRAHSDEGDRRDGDGREGGGRDADHAHPLAGAVVGFSGFMAMQGELADAAYYAASHAPATVRDGEEERPAWPAWPDLGKRRLDFWFYVGVCDSRARLFRWFSSFGLEDKPSGQSARIEGDRLVGDPALLDELETRYQEWRALGAPAMHQYTLRLIPAGREVDPRPRSQPDERTWTVPGKYYYRMFVLPAASAARRQTATGQAHAR